jgi:hypothetical protein
MPIDYRYYIFYRLINFNSVKIMTNLKKIHISPPSCILKLCCDAKNEGRACLLIYMVMRKPNFLVESSRFYFIRKSISKF